MDELNLTFEQALALIAVLIPLVVYEWYRIGCISCDITPKQETEGYYTPNLRNANYGAYIQAQGRYYN